MEDPDEIKIPVAWVGADEFPVLFSNQVITQIDGQIIFLTLGQLVPPAFPGETSEAFNEAAESIPFVPIKPLVRLAMTPDGLRELAAVIETTIQKYNQLEQTNDPRTTDGEHD